MPIHETITQSGSKINPALQSYVAKLLPRLRCRSLHGACGRYSADVFLPCQ
jgi:hypothetical protein